MRDKTLGYLELKHLRAFCIKNEIDEQEIDNSLTYDENLEYLKTLAPTRDFFNPDYSLVDKDSPEALQIKKEMEDLEYSFKHRPLYEKYGIPEWALDSLEKPFMVFNFYFKIPFHLSNLLKRKLKDYEASKIVTWYNKWYFRVQGTAKEILEVSYKLPAGVQLFAKDKPYQKGVILTEKGWIRIPEMNIGVPLKVLAH